MKDSLAYDSSWASIALTLAAEITNASPGRGSATQAEAHAAETVRRRLVSLSVMDIRQQPFWGLRSIWLFFALACGLTLVGHAAYWLLSGPAGWQVALPLSLAAFSLSAFLLWRKLTFQDYPLRQSLPHGDSQNVVAVLPAVAEVYQRVVLVAHLDSHRAVWAFAGDRLLRLGMGIVPVAIYGVLAAPLLYLLAQFTQWTIFAWAALPFALVHFIAWFTGVTADLGPYSPGANDNASAVGTLLALVERMKQEPLAHTEVWLAFTGCEESGCDGMRAFLDEYGAALKDALFIDFELVGIGERLAYLQSEGMLRKQSIPPPVERLALRVGQDFGGLFPIKAAAFGAFTENGVLLEKGFCSLCLMVLRQDSTLLPEWHRLTDRPDRLQVEALDLAHRFAWALLQRLDGEPFEDVQLGLEPLK
jgi:hypothetical protein